MRAAYPILWLICWSLGSGAFVARPADPAPGTPAITNAATGVAFPPLPKPQVTYFRELLALSPGELDRALAGIAEPGRRRLQAKLQEYLALAPDERETRLRATELCAYLAPLMRTPPTNRVAQLARVPVDFRPLVEERLKVWDGLAPETQKQLQESQWLIRWLGQLRYASDVPKTSTSAAEDLPQPQREILEQQLASLRALSPTARQQMCDRFQQFFDLSPREKEQILRALPDAERGAMDNTLQAFEKLPPDQRSLCVRSFREFVGLTPEERAEFLKNARRWKAMAPAERQTWRIVVTKLPPLPPGFGEPPLPPRFQQQTPGPATAPLPNTPINLTNAAQ